MTEWKRLLSRLGLRHDPGLHTCNLDETLHTALTNLAAREGRPEDEIAAALLATGLTQYQIKDELWQRWQSLSPREQQVGAMTCLGYTNRQIAAWLGISPETVKTHLRNTLYKFNLRSKPELRMMLDKWDFSKWEIF